MPLHIKNKYFRTNSILNENLVNSDFYFQNLENLNGDVVVKSKVKRVFDIIFSLFVLVFIFSWLYIIVAILIKLTSKGPVLFIQDRVGLNNKYFKCFKFRTMKTVPVKYMYTPTTRGDTRITIIGSFLRKSNLDELPQFINVLLGQMSVVGPRPHAIAFHKIYSSFLPNIKNRQLVKPGITGFAQIVGYRGDVEDFEENKRRTKYRVEYDCMYIANWSLIFDFKIILITIQQMLGTKTKGH